jgi:DNA-binding protein YbaB
LTANQHPKEPQIGEGQPGAALLAEADELRSALDDHRHFLKNAQFEGTDEAKTVAVMITADYRLTFVQIQDGLIRLGADAVAQRLNEACDKAGAAAAEAVEAKEDKLVETLGLTAAVMENVESVVKGSQPGPA